MLEGVCLGCDAFWVRARAPEGVPLGVLVGALAECLAGGDWWDEVLYSTYREKASRLRRRQERREPFRVRPPPVATGSEHATNRGGAAGHSAPIGKGAKPSGCISDFSITDKLYKVN